MRKPFNDCVPAGRQLFIAHQFQGVSRIRRFPRDEATSDALPCELPEQCALLNVRRVDLLGGRLWTAATNAPLVRLQIWGRDGLLPPVALRAFAPDFYLFDGLASSPGDAILFATDANGVVHAGCSPQGVLPSGPPAAFLDAFEWETGLRPCAARGGG